MRKPIPQSLSQAQKYFSDPENCRRLRWQGKVTCPICGSQDVTWLAAARLWKCYSPHPRAKFSLKSGTIFEDSPIAIEKWLTAMWMLVNRKTPVTAAELQRTITVTQKTAWFMLHRLRLALQDLSASKPGGEIEMDEAFLARRKSSASPRLRV